MKIKPSEILIPVISVIVVIGLWLLSYYLISNYPFIPNTEGLWAKRGQLGDMFGAVNALFSGLAFAGIIYTIYLQRQELRDQRKELELTRKEFQQQNETLWLQRLFVQSIPHVFTKLLEEVSLIQAGDLNLWKIEFDSVLIDPLQAYIHVLFFFFHRDPISACSIRCNRPSKLPAQLSSTSHATMGIGAYQVFKKFNGFLRGVQTMFFVDL